MDSGRIINVMALADRFGKMELSIKDTGKMTWPTAWVVSSKQVEMSIRENGSMTKPKEKESIFIKMELHTLENG